MTKKDENNEKIIEDEKKKKKQSKESKKELKTLYELVNDSEIDMTHIVIKLSMNGYLKQYEEEKEKIKQRNYVEPTITESEFKKIIG